MKNRRLSYPILLMLIVFGMACQPFQLNTDDLELKLNFDIIKTNIAFHMMDAATGDYILTSNSNPLTVTFYGDDSQWIVNSSGSKRPSVTCVDGFVSLGLDPYNAVPSANDPVNFRVVIEGDGYLSTSASVNLFRTGNHDVELRVVNMANPPNGVIVKGEKDAGSARNGSLDNDVKIFTDGNEANITISKGTVLTDSRGNKLEGKLDISLVHFDPTKTEAVSCIPGGLGVNVRNESGNQEKGVFVSAGFVAIDIKDESGKKVSNFGQNALELDAKIDESVINPKTGRTVQKGDILPIWSYNDETGAWKFERNVEVKGTPTGLRTEASLTHLSWWNFDWLDDACPLVELFFTIAPGDPNGLVTMGYNFLFRATLASGGQSFVSQGLFSGFPELSTIQTDTNTEFFQSVPLNKTIRIEFFYTGGGSPLWNLPDPIELDLCANSPIEVPITAISGGGGGGTGTICVNFSVTVNCTDTGLAATLGTIPIKYRKQGTNLYSSYVNTQNGSITLCGLERGQVYEALANYDGSLYPAPDKPFEFYIEPGMENNATMTFTLEIDCGG